MITTVMIMIITEWVCYVVVRVSRNEFSTMETISMNTELLNFL
jgi:hypothetical protein